MPRRKNITARHVGERVNHQPHERAEIIAGAIALDEATNDERIEYRRHLAGCVRCLNTLGGEHELLRLSALVGEARESEVWEPDVHGPLISRLAAAPRRFITYSVGFLALCLVVSFLGHLIVGSQLTQLRPSLQDPLTISYEGNRIILQRRSVRDQKPALKARPQVVVDHNVVRPVVRPAEASAVGRVAGTAPIPRTLPHNGIIRGNETAPTVPAQQEHTASLESRRSLAADRKAQAAERAGSAPESGAVPASAATQNIERIAFAPSYVTREAAPDGGDTAINPKYNELAYEEHAEGTVSYEVTVDAQGNPINFVIVKSSGFLVLDKAVKDAAMSVHYKPALLNGKPVAGIYRDAITFHAAPTSD